jgi:hypothetical protein
MSNFAAYELAVTRARATSRACEYSTARPTNQPLLTRGGVRNQHPEHPHGRSQRRMRKAAGNNGSHPIADNNRMAWKDPGSPARAIESCAAGLKRPRFVVSGAVSRVVPMPSPRRAHGLPHP